MVPEGHVPGRPDLGLSVGTGMRCWTLGVGREGVTCSSQLCLRGVHSEAGSCNQPQLRAQNGRASEPPGPRTLRGGEGRLRNDPRLPHRAGPSPACPLPEGTEAWGSSTGPAAARRNRTGSRRARPALRQAERAAGACEHRPDRLRGRFGDRSHSPAEERDMTELGPLRGPGVLGTGLLGREGQAGPGGRRKASERHCVPCH